MNITGGTVTANGGADAAGIGGRLSCSCTIYIGGSCTVVATGGTGNQSGGAGIGGGKNSDGGNITIAGGHVTAYGGSYAAGIGGGKYRSGGTIIISGGTVIAVGICGAGIGGGDGGAGGNITISGGSVTASSTDRGAGIGGGWNSSCGNITITGGTVSATGGGVSYFGYKYGGAGIGGGSYDSGGTITITGGKVTASSAIYSYSIGNGFEGSGAVITLGWTSPDDYIQTNNGYMGRVNIAPDRHFTDEYDTSADYYGNSVTIPGDRIVKLIPKGVVAYMDVNGETEYASGTVQLSADSLELEDGWYFAASGQTNVPERITVTGTVRMILKDGAELNVPGGITVAAGSTLIIYAQSAGESMGGLIINNVQSYKAGIGGGGSITVVGGAVTVRGGNFGAGIGGGDGVGGGSITACGGIVTATGGSGAAGMGGGSSGSGGSITVSGGTVTANGGSNAAGIGGGFLGSGGEISITGGRVTANGGSGASSIGSGKNGSGAVITLGWTDEDDFIKDNNERGFGGTVNIAADRYLRLADGSVFYTGNGVTLPAGAELVPCFAYTVAFDPNGGSGSMDGMTALCGFPSTLTASVFTREGFVFVGWNTQADGLGTTYADGASLQDLSTVDGDTVTLYAAWRAEDAPYFTESGMELRERPEQDGCRDLRFILKFNYNNSHYETYGQTGEGTHSITELGVRLAYTVNGVGVVSGWLTAARLFSTTDTEFVFTVVITGIPEEYSDVVFSVDSYVKYDDGAIVNGITAAGSLDQAANS